MEKKNWPGWKIMILSMVVLLAAGGMVFAAAQKDQIIIGQQQEPDNLNWILSDMSATSMVRNVYTRDLVEWDDKWNLVPVIAKQVPSLENGLMKLLPGNKLQVTYKLRKGLKWSDGAPITADDVLFTYKAIMNDDLKVPTRDTEVKIESITAPDKYTVVIIFKEPYVLADQGFDYYIIPKHALEPLLAKGAKTFMEAEFSRKPVGNGPYVVKEWVPGSHIILEPNPNYNIGSKPKLKRVIFKFISDTNTLMANMVSGAIDAVTPVGLQFDQGVALEKQAKDISVDFTPALVWEHIDFNLDDPILKDKRVRQALTYAIDREAISQALFEGKQKVAHSWLPPKHYAYNSKVKVYNYDEAKAKTLLAEAGWKPGSDGILVNEKGERLSLTIATTAGNKVREQVEQIIQNYYKKIGVELKIENQTAKVFFGETTPKRKFQMAMYAWVNSPSTVGESLWTARNIPNDGNGWTGQNRAGWNNAENEKLYAEIPVTMDKKKRVALLLREQELWAEELPAIPLYYRVDISAVRKGLQNWRPTGMLHPITWNIEKWTWSE